MTWQSLLQGSAPSAKREVPIPLHRHKEAQSCFSASWDISRLCLGRVHDTLSLSDMEKHQDSFEARNSLASAILGCGVRAVAQGIHGWLGGNMEDMEVRRCTVPPTDCGGDTASSPDFGRAPKAAAAVQFSTTSSVVS